MKQNDEYRKRVSSFQKSILIVHLILMVIGGTIFSLGVISRPILRITKPEYFHTVKWIVNVMIGAGIAQIAAAAYDIFSGCWKLIWPIYLGIAVTGLTVILELTAIGTSIFLYTRSASMVNEELISPWYWVECLRFHNCHDTMLRYIHWFILPQVLMAVVTVLLQCVGVMLLGRLVKTIAEHFIAVQNAGKRYHDEFEHKQWDQKEKQLKKEDEPQPSTSKAAEIQNPNLLRTPRVKFSSDNENNNNAFEMRSTNYEVDIHVECNTPASILQTDHGYIAGSRVSLDFDKI
ncbi:unnamed protein product [Orchesella dallaii]|uniref:Uncharacterized protein n=1 Tax=Orchesella dallaii TaxID=48710 RepID=A0ABP1R4A4_9HEXA